MNACIQCGWRTTGDYCPDCVDRYDTPPLAAPRRPLIYRDPADKGRLPLVRISSRPLRWALIAGTTWAAFAIIGLIATVTQ